MLLLLRAQPAACNQIVKAAHCLAGAPHHGLAQLQTSLHQGSRMLCNPFPRTIASSIEPAIKNENAL